MLAFMNAACGDATDPSDEVLICRGNISWMAIQVANEPLQIVEGSRRLRRSQPVMVIEHDLLRGLRLLYMSAEQAAAMLTCPGNTGTGPPTTGSVVPASVSSGFATISARSVSTTASGSFPTFEIPVFPKPFDLVANRSSDRKTVVRRHLDGNTIAPIDFDTEGFFPDAQTITVTGGDPRFPFHTISYLVTAGGTTGLLGRTPLPAPI